MADPMIYSETPPARSPRRGGINTVATFVDGVPLGRGRNVEFVGGAYEFPHEVPADCWISGPGGDKTENEGLGTEKSTDVFGAYIGVSCFIGSGVDFEERAAKQLGDTADRHIEEKLAAITVDETVPGGGSITEAIAAAENFFDDLYTGQPVIYLNRGDAVLAAAADSIYGDKEGNLWTVNGTPVVASAKFAKGTVKASGALTIYRSAVITTLGQELNKNTERGLAEQLYAIAFDIFGMIAFTITPTP